MNLLEFHEVLVDGVQIKSVEVKWAGTRAATAMSLIQSAKLNGLNPLEYLKDVMDRLPTQPYSKVGELLPHNWKLASVAAEA